MTIDPNVLVALCTLALALITVIMAYFSAKNVILTSILARISTLKLLSEEKKEIIEKFKNKYGLDKYDPSPEKIAEKIENITKSDPKVAGKVVEDYQNLYALEVAIRSLREEIIQKMIPYKNFKEEYEELVNILGKSINDQILSTDKKEK